MLSSAPYISNLFWAFEIITNKVLPRNEMWVSSNTSWQDKTTLLAKETLQSKTPKRQVRKNKFFQLPKERTGFQSSCYEMKYLEGNTKNGKHHLSSILTKKIYSVLVLSAPESNSLTSNHFFYYCIYIQKKGHPIIAIWENIQFFSSF